MVLIKKPRSPSTTRCEQRLARDGKNTPVSRDETDMFYSWAWTVHSTFMNKMKTIVYFKFLLYSTAVTTTLNILTWTEWLRILTVHFYSTFSWMCSLIFLQPNRAFPYLVMLWVFAAHVLSHWWIDAFLICLYLFAFVFLNCSALSSLAHRIFYAKVKWITLSFALEKKTCQIQELVIVVVVVSDIQKTEQLIHYLRK